MANICDQQLYIVAETTEDMLELVASMAATFEQAAVINPLADVEEPEDLEECVDALSDALQEFNGLHLIDVEPDVRAESNWISLWDLSDKPCLNLNLCLKWSPSAQIAPYCAKLDAEKYGFATINGGEYMCAMEDEIAFIQWGENPGDAHDNPLDYDAFIEWKEQVLDSDPESLNEEALQMLFKLANEGTFYWSVDEDDDWDDEDEDEE